MSESYLLFKALMLGILLIASFIWGQFLFDRHLADKMTSWLNALSAKPVLYWIIVSTSLVFLAGLMGWWVTP
jgi:TRAP-type C4-dicarboxylate transport system permease large subunit